MIDESVNEANVEARGILESAKKEVEELKSAATSRVESATESVVAKLLGVR